MNTNILCKFIISITCFFCSVATLAQDVNIRCTLRDQNGNIITGAVFMQDAESSVIGTKLPLHDQLATSFRNKLVAGQVKEDQTVLIKAGKRLPYYLFFSAPGKKTYMSFFPATEKDDLSVTITLYDTLFKRDESEVNIQTNDDRINKWVKVAALTNRTAQTPIMDYLDAKVEYVTKNGAEDGFTFDLSGYYKKLLQEYQSSDERQLKNFILAQIAFLCIGNKFPVEEKYLIELVKEAPSNDWIWITGIGQTALSGIYIGMGKFEKSKKLLLPFYESLAENSYLENKKASFMFMLLSLAASEDLPEATGYYSKLLSNYTDSNLIKRAIQRYGTTSKILTGADLPNFSVRNIERNGEITNNSIKGKITLIDFWATWCGPCIAQFGNLEKVYAKYKNNGFEILSMSLDAEMETVKLFKQKRYKMPWLNGFVGEAASRMRKEFDLGAIPRVILVDADGKVLNDKLKDLSDDNLEKTLAKLFDSK